MPMCQSPKIADVLLRAGGLPANDNYVALIRPTNSGRAKRTFNAAWQAFAIVLCIMILQLH